MTDPPPNDRLRVPGPTGPSGPAASIGSGGIGVPLGYRPPVPAGQVSADRLVGTVLLGLFWAAAGVVGAGLLAVVALQTLGVDRPPPKRAEALALCAVCAVCLGPASLAAFGLAVRHLVVLPIRMARAARPPA